MSKALFGNEHLMEKLDLLLLPEHGAAAACWFWKTAGCNQLADVRDFKGVTRRVNGYPDRLSWLSKLRAFA